MNHGHGDVLPEMTSKHGLAGPLAGRADCRASGLAGRALSAGVARLLLWQERKIDLSMCHVHVVHPHPYLIAQTVGLSGILPDKTKAVRVIYVMIGEPGNVHEAFNKQVCEFDEQPEPGHSSNDPSILLPELIEHKFDFFQLDHVTFGVIGKALTL